MNDSKSRTSLLPRTSIQAPQSREPSRALHVIALLTACATFPLIFMGGLVTSHQAGMSVPDWPNSYGYNMFLFPPRLWIGGILYEHTHRLAGSAVGLLAIALVVCAWRAELAFACRWAWSVMRKRPRLPWSGSAETSRDRWLAVAVLGAVILQGVLGGLRVVLVKLGLAVIHGCFAQAFFCLVAFAAVASSRWWNRPSHISPPQHRGRRLVLLGAMTVAAVYAQLVVGALMRHHQAGLAIPDLPLAYGKVLPPINQQQLDAVNYVRVRQYDLDAVTLGQVWLHFGHRLGAVLVSVMVIALATLVIRRYRMQPRLLRPALLLVFLLAAQLTLGVLSVLLRKPADVASAHVAVGALVLVSSFVLTARAARLYGMRRRKAAWVSETANHADALAMA